MTNAEGFYQAVEVRGRQVPISGLLRCCHCGQILVIRPHKPPPHLTGLAAIQPELPSALTQACGPPQRPCGALPGPPATPVAFFA